MITKLLHLLPPERAHAIGKWAMQRRLRAPGIYCTTKSACTIFGTTITNPLGLAAGFDKNGELADHAHRYGFGWVEVGSVTLRGGSGNPKPRLFRIEMDGLLNRMGLNGDPAEIVAERLSKATRGCFAVNITKTHDPLITGDAAINDMVLCYQKMRPYGIYTVLNISCPNTKEKTFEDPVVLRDVLMEITSLRRGRPLLVKLSPTLIFGLSDNNRLVEVISICKLFQISGYVCSNTVPMEHFKYGRGGNSGPVVKPYSLRLIELIRKMHPEAVIIGCGGVQTGQDMADYMAAGAQFVQSYAGFVVGPNAGPRFAHRVLAEHEELIG